MLSRLGQGNAHVVFNGSFYYHQKDSPTIIRYDLEKRETICKDFHIDQKKKKIKKMFTNNNVPFDALMEIFIWMQNLNESFSIWYKLYSCMYVRLLFIGNVTLPEFQWSGDHYLYTTKCNYVDLNADENGLWAIYSTPKSTNTYVVKVILCSINESAKKHSTFDYINWNIKRNYLSRNLFCFYFFFHFSFFGLLHIHIHYALQSISLMQSLWKFSTAGMLA